jgi:phosphate acetyltransferase
LIDQARARGPVAVAVAYPCDSGSVQAAMQAAEAGLIRPLLVGPRSVSKPRLALPVWTVCRRDPLHGGRPRIAAAQAAALCRDGQARSLMKGSLHSDDLLGAAVAREAGLRGSRRASHVFIMDIPGYDRPLLMTDCVVNIFPSLMEKRDIAQNAVDLAHAIGIVQPRVALLSAVETVNPAIPGTIDAAALCKMADRGQITGGIFDGPLAYDNAISLHSAHNKGIVSDVAGRPDILLAPNLEAGNMIYKQLVSWPTPNARAWFWACACPSC